MPTHDDDALLRKAMEALEMMLDQERFKFGPERYAKSGDGILAKYPLDTLRRARAVRDEIGKALG